MTCFHSADDDASGCEKDKHEENDDGDAADDAVRIITMIMLFLFSPSVERAHAPLVIIRLTLLRIIIKLYNALDSSFVTPVLHHSSPQVRLNMSKGAQGLVHSCLLSSL